MNPVKRDYVLDQIDRLLRPRFLHGPGWRVVAVFRDCVESWCNDQMTLGADADAPEQAEGNSSRDGKTRSNRQRGKAPQGRADGGNEERDEARREEQLQKMAQVFEDIEAEEASRKKMKLTNFIT